MADLSQLERALINADKAGDTEAAKTLAGEITRMRAQPVNLKPQEFNRDMLGIKTEPVANKFGGVVRGLRDPIDAGAQLLVRGANKVGLASEQDVAGVDEINRQAEQDYQQNWRGETGLDVGRIAGSMVGTSPAMRLIPAVKSFKGMLTASGGAGGIQGLLSPVDMQPGTDFATEKTQQGLLGTAAGLAAAPVAYGASRVVNPQTRPQVKTLLDEGITPTPGQIMGGRWQVAEDKLTSLPILGDAISSARGKGLDEFNRAAYGRALRPITGKVPKEVGREGVKDVRDQLSDAYDTLLPKISFKADSQFVGELQQLRGMASQLPKQQSEQFEKIIETHLQGKMTPQGLMNGARLKEVESELGRLAKGYRGDASFDNRQLGDAVGQLQNLIRQNLVRMNPKHAEALSQINTGYANYAKLRDAASRQGSADGKFTPAQLSAAVRSGDKTVGKRAFSEGDALMQDLSDAGKNVLSSKYPDSGSIGRLALGAGTVGGGYLLSPTALTATGLASLPYLPGGRQIMAGLLTKRPDFAEPLSVFLRGSTPYLGATSYGLLNE